MTKFSENRKVRIQPKFLLWSSKTHFNTKTLVTYTRIMTFPQINKCEHFKLLIQAARIPLPRNRCKSSLMMSSKYLSKFSRKS